MTFWANFYEKLFNFREIRYFDIQGEYTGLTSKALTAPDGKIRIPLNEESSKGSGQIEEFLMKFNGEGIQHIALLERQPDRHHRPARPGRRAADDRAQRHLLRDAGDAPAGPWRADRPNCRRAASCWTAPPKAAQPRLLLQIFSETAFGGPVFFEFIQRKGDYSEGFGEGNFKALFQSIERDQVRRGVLTAA